MAIGDVECCDLYDVHEEVVQAVRERMPEEDKLYDLDFIPATGIGDVRL